MKKAVTLKDFYVEYVEIAIKLSLLRIIQYFLVLKKI